MSFGIRKCAVSGGHLIAEIVVLNPAEGISAYVFVM
jgi:hypothetical protein